VALLQALATMQALAAMLALAATPPRALAQGNPQQLAAADGVGTVDAVIGPAMLRLRLKGGTFWIVVPAPNAQVEVVGTASREMLQPGQFVSCSLQLDELGKAAEPVTQLTFPGGGMPGVTAGGLGIAEPGAKRVGGKRPAGTYLVSGPIKLVKDDVITVQAGRDRFEITVPPEAELLVRTANCGLASPGDKVEVEGQYLQQGELQATKLKVELANPVTPPAKNRGRRPVKAAD
jgi:hypothetical protein